MSKISSEPEEGESSSLIDDEKLDYDKDEILFELVKIKKNSKEDFSEAAKKATAELEKSDIVQDNIFKKMTPKRHTRNESVSITKFSSLDMNEMMSIIPPEIPKRATEFQMFVTEATDDYNDERGSSFDKEELSDKISSESSREIEMSIEKKWSDGGVSDKISSEDAVTDKISSDSPARVEFSDPKVIIDTLHDIDRDDEDDRSIEEQVMDTMKGDGSALEKLENKLAEMREDVLHDVHDAAATKLDDTLSKMLNKLFCFQILSYFSFYTAGPF